MMNRTCLRNARTSLARGCTTRPAQWQHLDSEHSKGETEWPRDADTAKATTNSPSTYGETGSQTAMNEYGQLAMDHWKTYQPQEYAQIQNPTSHFAALGETAQEQAAQIEEEIVRSLPTSPDYLKTVASRNQARLTAREIVLAELLPSPEAETEGTESSDPRDAMVDPSGMPTDPSHPLWEDLDNDAISPSEFQTRRKAWIDSLPTR